jgi:hypothetical protein
MKTFFFVCEQYEIISKGLFNEVKVYFGDSTIPKCQYRIKLVNEDKDVQEMSLAGEYMRQNNSKPRKSI